MKLSKKLKRQLKKRLLICMSSITFVLMLIAGGKLAGIPMLENYFGGVQEKVLNVSPINGYDVTIKDNISIESLENEQNLTNSQDVQEQINIVPESTQILDIQNIETSNELSNTKSMFIDNKLSNTDTITYIYDAQDLVNFRNSVNNGDTYLGETVYLMNNIDMSTVCSVTTGSFTPIGATGTNFAGTFNGNYHEISNLYISSNEYPSLGLFVQIQNTAIIENLVMKNLYIYNNYNTNNSYTCAGGIVGTNNGKIINCGVESGSVAAYRTVSYSGRWLNAIAGGIAGNSNNAEINSCYNKAKITGSNNKVNYLGSLVGGIVGDVGAANKVINCYNVGTVEATGYAVILGGIVGDAGNSKGATVVNSYNRGTLTNKGAGQNPFIAGIVARGNNTKPSNSYCITGNNHAYYSTTSSSSANNTGMVAAANIQTYTATLGSAFAYDIYNKNDNYPVLSWQNETTVMNLNKNQAYIKINEELHLNVVEDDKVKQILGKSYQASDFKWTSTNEDVATVNENGVVRGLSDGYTTIYAHHEESGLYAMCVINVAKDFTAPQIATGNGFTVILKSDGTVVTIGNNEKGTLGNGTTESSKEAVNVRIDIDTELKNIVKIAVGSNHVLALASDGKVYAWGANNVGQLGQNNTDDQVYAKLVLGEEGSSYLTNIVDIDAGATGSIALDKNGNVYVWGNGINGEIGDSAKLSKSLPVKVEKVKHAIQVQMGNGHVGALTSEGVEWSWGLNTNGQLGINCTVSTSWPMKTALDITELSLGAAHTTVKNIDGNLYAVGACSNGRLGTTGTTNQTKYIEISLPEEIRNNQIKYVKSGMMNTTILLKNGSVWETGFNLQGELGIGTDGSAATSTTFIQGLTNESTPIENVLTIGKNLGNVAGSATAGYGLNTAVILKNGDVYTTGDNTYGQIGNNSTASKSYYTKMGYAYLDYEDKAVEVDEQGYQIDLNKLKYIQQALNVYNQEVLLKVGDKIKYTLLDDTLATLDENGKITPKKGVTGITRIKIEDLANNYETYFTIIINKLKNTDTVTYIYTSEDMVNFKNSVNSGDDYTGKTVYVMADIDMSNVCSESIGSWEPIGINTYFAGTFDGNYHKVRNLYINSNAYPYLGLFTQTKSTSIIKNLILEDLYVYSNYNTSSNSNTVGGIVGNNTGKIINCGVESGSVTSYRSIYVNGKWLNIHIGGIAGNSSGEINSCYNKASISGTNNKSKFYLGCLVGGIVGNASGTNKVINCYNIANLYGTGYALILGGIVGDAANSQSTTVSNCYNIGSLTNGGGTNVNIAGLVARGNNTRPTNSYCINGNTHAYYPNMSSSSYVNTGMVQKENLKNYSTTLGLAYEKDDWEINEEYPILWWEAPSVELSHKQVYIEENEELKLNIIVNETVDKILERKVSVQDFDWKSTNEDIATVNEDAKITGVSEGYTTIYGHHKEKDLYAMCVVYVSAKGKQATPQIETGENFTAILKPDGTVWTIGNNEKGQLGDGTNEERIEAVQVKTSDGKGLTGIIKISVGTNHVLALTDNGEIYAWGANDYGQLGINNTESSNYAVKVLGEGGSSILDRIIDISAGAYGSSAINEFGWVYVWGNGTYGEMGNATTISNSTPTKTTVNNGISVSTGSGHNVALAQSGRIYTWGRNTYGELGIGNTANNTTVLKVADKATEISAAGYETVVKDIDKKVYVAGLNTSGQLGLGTYTNVTKLTETKLPEENSIPEGTDPQEETINNDVKYVKAGSGSITIQLKNGEIYTIGINTKGELGVGTNTNETKFVRGKIIEKNEDEIEEVVELENTLIIGRSNGENTSLDIATINENGRVYTAGANTNGQIGDNTKNDTNYFTKMGYVKVNYPEKIEMKVGDIKHFTEEDIQYKEIYFNINKEDVIKKTLINNGIIQDEEIATYETGTVTAKTVGNTILIIKKEETKTLVYIPVKVLPQNTEGTVVPDVKTGDNFTISLKSDGTIWSFGTNTNGELGLGDKTYRNSPKQVKILKEESTQNIEEIENIDETVESEGQVESEKTEKLEIIEQIAVGNSHVIVLTEDGKVYTWGLNSSGQLGNGTKTNSYIPQEVQMPEGKELVKVIQDTVIKIIANKNVSYAITQQGKVYAWGEGYGTKPTLLEKTIEKTIEVEEEKQDKTEKLEINLIDLSNNYMLDIEGNVYSKNTGNKLEIEEKIKQISEGTNHTLFLSKTGKGYSIGQNAYGQLGNGDYSASENNVVKIKSIEGSTELQNIIKLEAGDGYSVAILKDGKLLEWGANRAGQLGIEQSKVEETCNIKENEHVSSLVEETKQKLMIMDAGGDHVAIALTDGNVYTWGLNTDGELGNATNDNSIVPQLVGKNIVETNINNLILSENETFDINANTTYFNLLQEIGNEIEYESKDTQVITVNNKTGEATAVRQGKTIIVAKEKDTDNMSVIQVRVLPDGIEIEQEPEPEPGQTEHKKIKIEPEVVTNGSHTVTLKVDGTVWCYGNNSNGELGNETTKYSDEPVQAIFPEGTIIIQISAGENFSLALDSEGHVWAWGANDYYQLGSTIKGYINKPTKVQGLERITKISAGSYSALAIDENKEVYGWGLNSNGELGIGSYTNKVSIPTKAKYISDIIDIEIGKNHAIALKTTGEVYVTGLNMYGQLGSGNTTIKKVSHFTKVESLKEVGRIGTTESGNIIATVDGEVYTWGLNIYGELGLGDKTNRSTPEKVVELQNIVDIDGGKNHAIALDRQGKVYLAGSNRYGQLGNGTIEDNTQFGEIQIKDIMTVSAGNTYTAMAKTDGTVWGNGDYNHGDTTLKSKTNSLVPMQVGNDTFGLGVIKVTVKKEETVNITKNIAFSFNLMFLNKNNVEDIEYTSLNEEIAIVDEEGNVTGKKEGFTWVKATEADGKEHVVGVYVIDKESEYAPEVSAGEDFATVLKSEGTIWTFGHNNNGELGIGSNKTKDIPERTNVNASYSESNSGNSFTIALRKDGTVWSFGKNNYGQLGTGNTNNLLSPMQISGIGDIVQIAVGKEHVVAMDSYGILYGWGRNIEQQLGIKGTMIVSPTVIPYTEGTISSVWAGENETVIINTQGKVYGYGSLLKGELKGIDNAVKVSIGKGYMLILTTSGEVYKYDGKLVKVNGLSEIVDIDVTGKNNIAQTKNEEVYTWVDENVPVKDELENIYTIGVGVNNYYVILTDGTVYAKGNNKYGQLGNSTRIDSEKFTLIGDRQFNIDPETATMKVGDIENIDIQGNPFNVFNFNKLSSNEYTFVSDEENVVSVESGKLKAVAEGTAHITITDKVTGEQITITRIVIAQEEDRILEIKVDDTLANLAKDSTKEKMKYEVKVVTDKNTGLLQIKTKEATDRIKINDSEWQENGTFSQEVSLESKTTEFTITVGVKNNENNYPVEYTYTLIVEKISDDIQLDKITVTSTDDEGNTSKLQAIPISTTKYEVIVDEPTQISEVEAVARSEYSFVSIDGLEYSKHTQKTNIDMENSTSKEIIILVKSEAETEVEYTLIINKKNEAMNLSSLKVNDKEARKVSETMYVASVKKDCDLATIEANVVSNLANISIANKDYELSTSTRQVKINSNVTQVSIKVMLQEDIKEYTLYIYKTDEEIEESLQLEVLLVNGVLIEPEEENGKYVVYLPSVETEATIKAIAKESTTLVNIDNQGDEEGDSERKVEITEDENEYTVKLTNTSKDSKEYKVIIRKAEKDTTLDKIYVTKEDLQVQAELQDDGTYLVKLPLGFEDAYVTAVARYPKAKVQVNQTGKYVIKQDTQNVKLQDTITQVIIKVESDDGTNENSYILNIVKKSNNADLNYIEVNEKRATLQDDGTYLINLSEALTEVNVKAQAKDENADIKIDGYEFNKQTTTETVKIDSKETICTIYVKAEDGTVKKYTLRISGLPDDSTLQSVTVNGIEAKYIEGENKYEIRSEETNFNIVATATDNLAKVSLNENKEDIGSSTITVTKENEVTIVKIKVTAQDGIDSTEYILEIKEKSNDTALQSVVVNGQQATINSEGNYIASIKGNEDNAIIVINANDSFATVYLDEDTQNESNLTITKTITQKETKYTIKVEAEDGTEQTYKLIITKLSSNIEIKKLSVTMKIEKVSEGESEDVTEESTQEGSKELQTEEKTVVLEPLEDGNYYLKIERVDNVDVKAILEDNAASVKIRNSNFVLAENSQTINTVSEITNVIITVKAEDGTIKTYTLILEKKSNDTSIKSIESEDLVNIEEQKVYVDEELESIDLKIVTNSELAYIKEQKDEDNNYKLHEITVHVDLTEELIPDEENQLDEGIPVKVVVKAEDGTIEEHTIKIIKFGNTNLVKVKVQDEEVQNKNNIYDAVINVAETAKVEINAENKNATIQIIKVTENDDGEQTEEIIAESEEPGKLLKEDLPLEDDPQYYKIRVISAKESSIFDYDLIIELKSIETGIEYVKVDETNATVINDVYTSIVSKKDTYPLQIRLTDEKAEVKISYTYHNGEIEYEGEYQQGKLEEEVPVYEGETLEVTITVKAENGNTKTYTLNIKRISDNTDLEYVKVEGETVTNYDEDTKTYSITVDNKLQNAEIEVKAISEKAKVRIESEVQTQIVDMQVSLDGPGTEKMLTVTVTAEDGTNKEYYIRIIQLKENISLQSVMVNDKEATRIDIYTYEAIITDKEEIATIIATAQKDTSTVSINGEQENIQTSTKQIEVNGKRIIEVPIIVKADDETQQTYNLTIIVQDTNNEVEYVKVNDEDIEPDKEKITLEEESSSEEYKTIYKAVIKDDSEIQNIEIKAKSIYSLIEITNGDQLDLVEDIDVSSDENQLVSASGKLEISLKTPDNVTVIEFTVISEAGEEQNFTIILTKESADNSLLEVNVNGEKATKVDTNKYEITIKDTTGVAEIEAIAKAVTSTVSIDNEIANEAKGIKSILINGEKTINVKIVVKSKIGVEQTYDLTITVIEANTKLEYVKVNGSKIDPEQDGVTYKELIEDESEDASIEIKLEGYHANIEITNKEDIQITNQDGTEISEETLIGNTLSFKVKTPSDKTIIKYKVKTETEEEKEYTIILTKKSTDNSLLKVKVNEKEAMQIDENNYEITIEESEGTAIVEAIAKADTSKVSIDKGEAKTVSSTKTFQTDGKKLIEVLITVIAQNDSQQEYKLIIKILNNNNEIEYVKVNKEYVNSEDDEVTYKTFISSQSETADIEIKAIEDTSSIKIINTDDIEIVDVYSEEYKGISKFTVKTPNEETTIKYSITSEMGEEKQYTIILTKKSDDNSLKQLLVDDEEVTPDKDGSYHIEINDPKQVKVRAIANSKYAQIRINYENDRTQETEATIEADVSPTRVTITVTSQSGKIAKYYLYIRILTDNTELDKVIVDGNEVTNYEYETNTYTAVVDNSKNEYNVFLIAVNDEATVELFDGGESLGSDTGNLTDQITLNPDEESHIYTIKVYLDDERYTEYTLEVLRISSDSSLKIVEVDNIVRQPKPDDKNTYEVGIAKNAETVKIKVEATNKFATVQIADYATVRSGNTVTKDIELEYSRITIPIVVTAIDGSTDTFNIILIRLSDDTSLQKVVVNNKEVPNVNNVYTYYMSEEEYNADVEIFAQENNNAKIVVDNYEGEGYLQFNEIFDEYTLKVEKKIKVTSEDGTKEEEYTLILCKKTQIKGKIITDNFENRHISKISLYKTEEQEIQESEESKEKQEVEENTEEMQTKENLVKEIQTQEDGSFEIDIEKVGEYRIVVTKLGYLNYEVTNIDIKPGLIVDLGEYKLSAGDVIVTGEIEIDDLVSMNNNFEVQITDDNKICDLNEDGVIDSKDRDILQKNYSKMEEILVWVNPNAPKAEKQLETVIEDKQELRLELESKQKSSQELNLNSNNQNVMNNELKDINSTGTTNQQQIQENKLILPISCNYKITSDYGYRQSPITGKSEKHCGIDLSGDWHTEIHSIADGEVTWAGVKNSYGNCIEIKHVVNGETIYSFYAHLSRIDVKAGQKVKQGDVIALEGGQPNVDPNTGDTTGHHLHFEIRTKSGYGNDVDPNLYFDF